MAKKSNFIQNKLIVISTGFKIFYESIKNIVLKTQIDGVVYQPTPEELPSKKTKKIKKEK